MELNLGLVKHKLWCWEALMLGQCGGGPQLSIYAFSGKMP